MRTCHLNSGGDLKSNRTNIGFNEEYYNMNKKAILKFGIIIILGVVVASAAMSAGVMADAPTETDYSDILNDTEGDGSSSNPHVLTTLDELQAVQGNLSAHYVLGNNINASETETWNNGAGFTPLGKYLEQFSGSFDGQGYKVDGLYIHRPIRHAGLFGHVILGDIKNIGVTNMDIQGGQGVGGLVGSNEGGDITNSYSSGSVTGDTFVGGLVGDTTGDIMKSYSTGNVTGNSFVGGLVGYTEDSDRITKSYSTGSVSGDTEVGGLVGINVNTTIEKSYSNSNVSGNSEVGGLVGENTDSSYITKAYSTGNVTGDFAEGGLVGENYAQVTDSYWNTETSNQATSGGSATGLTKAEMTGSSAETKMVGFDFTSEWRTVSASDADSSADSYPIILDSSEEAVIVSESSSEEYGGMSTLVYVALLFVLFSVMVLLLVKD
jgi:hypothetical protein